MTKRHSDAVMHSSEDPNWRTPKACYAKLHAEFDFTLDGAADEPSNLCPYYFGPGSPYAEDSLTADLTALLDPAVYRIFLNPPFSRTLAAAWRTGKIKRDGEWVEHPKDLAKAASYDIENWVRWCYDWSVRGFTIVGLIPFAPQTEWYRCYVYGHTPEGGWGGHAAREERRLPHRISFDRSNGEKAANAGVNTAVIVWRPNHGIVGPWQPHQFYWSYR